VFISLCIVSLYLLLLPYFSVNKDYHTSAEGLQGIIKVIIIIIIDIFRVAETVKTIANTTVLERR